MSPLVIAAGVMLITFWAVVHWDVSTWGERYCGRCCQRKRDCACKGRR